MNIGTVTCNVDNVRQALARFKQHIADRGGSQAELELITRAVIATRFSVNATVEIDMTSPLMNFMEARQPYAPTKSALDD